MLSEARFGRRVEASLPPRRGPSREHLRALRV